MWSGTALLIVTFSDGCLQTLSAVTVHWTTVPGTTVVAGTSFTLFCPLASTTSCSTSATDLSAMQPGDCANACEPRLQAMRAAAAMIFRFPLNMCVSFTANFPVNCRCERRTGW